MHINNVHLKNLKVYECDQCDKEFSQQVELKIHIYSVHKKLKNHKCDLCDKSFYLANVLDTHIKTMHEGLKNHKCDQCDKVFWQPVDLEKHINDVHEEMKTPGMPPGAARALMSPRSFFNFPARMCPMPDIY